MNQRYFIWVAFAVAYFMLRPPAFAHADEIRFGLFKFNIRQTVSEKSGAEINPFIDNIPEAGKIGVRLVRFPLNWECVESESGRFDFAHCSQVKEIDRLISAGVEVQPNIRTKLMQERPGARDFWATESGSYPFAKKIASRPPRDLSSDFKESSGYSETYYRFISAVLDHFCKGQSCKIKEMVIENEANDDDQWRGNGNGRTGDVDDYIKIVKTAKKAIQARHLPIKLYDSGVQGYTLTPLAVKDALQHGNYSLASEIYESVFHQTLSREKLERKVEKLLANSAVQKTLMMLNSDLYKTVDALNFHHYQTTRSLPYVVDYLRRSIPPGKPLVCTEVGIKGNYVDKTAKMSYQIQEKALKMFSLGVNTVVWFSVESRGGNAANVIDNNGKISVENMLAVKRLAALVDGAVKVEPIKCPAGAGYRISYPSRSTDVCL